jgi:Outer membrane efflux protein
VINRKLIPLCAGLLLVAATFSVDVFAQRKTKKKPTAARPNELAKLREEFVQKTNEFKASLAKLLPFQEEKKKRAEEKLEQSRKLFAEGLIPRAQLEESERALTEAKSEIAKIQRDMANADAQAAGIYAETEAEREIAKNLRLARQSLVRTASFTRYTGAGSWVIAEAWKVQRFFSDTFNKQLPIAVFGQGAIHDRWRLDHRNAMDISLHPDSVEGQALLNFLQKNGIPYLAFRAAIPGTATGPHIHIGRPSHRY